MQELSATAISQRYRRLRPRLLLSMVVGYAAFYLTRKSVNYVLPALQLDLSLSKSDIGLLGSLFYLSYGLSKFAAGLWHDSHGSRVFMGIGLLAIKDEWFSDDLRRMDDDNVFRKLQGHWIMEMSEMIATANAKSIEEIKSFLSKQKETSATRGPRTRRASQSARP